MREFPGGLPYLEAVHPQARLLSENVFVQGEAFWWSWAERIAGRADPRGAAAAVARVLRTAGDGRPRPTP